jgi:hypothetical protein
MKLHKACGITMVGNGVRTEPLYIEGSLSFRDFSLYLVILRPAGRNLRPFGRTDTQDGPEGVEVSVYPYIRLGPRRGGKGDFLTVYPYCLIPFLSRRVPASH